MWICWIIFKIFPPSSNCNLSFSADVLVPLARYNHQEQYGMTGLEYDYDSLDKLILKSKTCTQAVVTMLKLKAFESVLRKCPNISSIGIQNRKFDFFNNDKMIQLITDLCKNLNEIDLDFNSFTNVKYNAFVAKFGSNLRKCDFYSGEYLEYKYFGDLLTKCPKLEHLNLWEIIEIILFARILPINSKTLSYCRFV